MSDPTSRKPGLLRRLFGAGETAPDSGAPAEPAPLPETPVEVPAEPVPEPLAEVAVPARSGGDG